MRWYEVATRLMKDRGVRHGDVAAALGVSRQAVSHKLKGVRPTTTDEIEIIAGLLGVAMGDLFAEKDAGYPLDIRTKELVDLFHKLRSDEQKNAFLRSLRLSVDRARG